MKKCIYFACGLLTVFIIFILYVATHTIVFPKESLYVLYDVPTNKPIDGTLALIGGTPYRVVENQLYQYTDSQQWEALAQHNQVAVLVSGDELCYLTTDGRLYCEGLDSTEYLPNGAAYSLFSSQEVVAYLNTAPAITINTNVTQDNFRSLQDSTTILYKGIEGCELYSFTEGNIIQISGNYLLTEDGNIYELYCDSLIAPLQIQLVYNGGDVISISAVDHTHRCVGLRKDGTVFSVFDQTALDVSSWNHMIAAEQGFYYVVGLTDEGKVLYTEADSEHAQSIQEQLAQWKNIIQVSTAYSKILGVDADGICYILELK